MANSRPNTAPEGRAKSKFVANRTNAMKEIEAWITEGDGYRHRDATRMSGQLTDNITEERMLRAKLWELSRERYKFLSQSEYEKKIFLEKIQRRSNSHRRQLGHSHERTPPLLGKRRKVKSSTARLALLDRFDPTKARDRPKEFKDDPERKDPGKDRVKFVHFGSDKIPQDPKLPKEDTLCAQNLARMDHAQRSQSASHIRLLPEIGDTKLAPNQVDIRRMFAIKNSSLQPIDSTRPLAGRRSKSGSIASSSSSLYCTDPRILNLENCLAPIHRADSSVDVRTVVEQMESLHLPPRVNKETRKPKTALRILQHMRARGLVV